MNRRRWTDNKGFTLIELMVVVAILSVLATLVAGGVQGTKGRGEESQVRLDAGTVFTAMQNYQNQSRESAWPEDTLPADATSITYQNTSIAAAYVAAISVTFTSGASSNYTTPGWFVSTHVRKVDGTITDAFFVPDFLAQRPDSIRLMTKAANGSTYPEYIWLLKKGTLLDDRGRSIQVWKLTDDRDKYIKIYPRVD